jgi:hypothetical protein
MAFDWDAGKAEAKGLSDSVLVARMQDAARAFVVLWREADSRRNSGLEVEVSILSDRIGIIVDAHRRAPV